MKEDKNQPESLCVPCSAVCCRALCTFSHKMTHHFVLSGFGTGLRAARMASSNTCMTPLWVSAEHSRYLTACISLAIARPADLVIGRRCLAFSFAMTVGSSRRSSFVPTRMTGVCGQCSRTSTIHCRHSKQPPHTIKINQLSILDYTIQVSMREILTFWENEKFCGRYHYFTIKDS